MVCINAESVELFCILFSIFLILFSQALISGPFFKTNKSLLILSFSPFDKELFRELISNSSIF